MRRLTSQRSSGPPGHAGASWSSANIVAMLGLLAAPNALAAPLAAVQTLEDGWTQAFNDGNIGALGAFYARDACLVLPGTEPVRGRSAIRTALTGLAGHAMSMSLRTEAVRPLGCGYLVENGVARYEVLDAKPGNGIVTANYQIIWKRDAGGRWIIVLDVVTPL